MGVGRWSLQVWFQQVLSLSLSLSPTGQLSDSQENCLVKEWWTGGPLRVTLPQSPVFLALTINVNSLLTHYPDISTHLFVVQLFVYYLSHARSTGTA